MTSSTHTGVWNPQNNHNLLLYIAHSKAASLNQGQAKGAADFCLQFSAKTPKSLTRARGSVFCVLCTLTAAPHWLELTLKFAEGIAGHCQGVARAYLFSDVDISIRLPRPRKAELMTRAGVWTEGPSAV